MKKTIFMTLVILSLGFTTFAQSSYGEMGNYGNNNGRERMGRQGRRGYSKGNHNGNKMGRRGQRKHLRGEFGFYIMQELNLTEKQEEKINSIKTDFKKKGIDLHAEIKKLRIDKREAMKNEEFSKAKSLVDKISVVRIQLNKNQISLQEAIHNELTDEQKKKLKVLKKERHRGIRSRRNNVKKK